MEEKKSTLRGLGYEPAAQKSESEPASAIPEEAPAPKKCSHPGEYGLILHEKERIFTPRRRLRNKK